ncbi:HAMP domain-containing histidine kinase [Paracoccus caeni]|uniref:histidine kinase n=1 Tax=Paracoccus caeni TaxID=657651 RepID=A0A934SIP4_9RHOB|nr:HAMP domain-containing sensor histidine kinase [Paracoccus caeni]MBK4218215.1 HAMP domain-containing histidine kinase [Paracoccus caeni]
MICRPSLRMRLWLAATTLAMLAVIAAAIAAHGLLRTQAWATEAMTAQQRIEAYGSYSARVNDWMLGWLTQAGSVPDAGGVMQAMDNLDRLVAEDVAAATDEAEATRRARQSMTPARLRGLFGQLQNTLVQTPPGTAEGDAAIVFYAAQAPQVVAGQIEQEARRRDIALATMEGLRRPFLWSAIGIGVAVPLVLMALYLLVLRPLFSRLGHATRAAEAMAAGTIPPGAGGHDELGLMFARLRQMSARVARRSARLETIVQERTASLSQANDRLAHIDANRRRFFADVGHELRTPLTVIMGEAELGARSKDAELRASFQTIMARAQRLFRRIEDILRIARSENGQLELVSDRVALNLAIEAALADLAPVLRRAGITVTHEVPQLAVAGDAEWLRQVFAGLFENAAKYAGQGAEVGVKAAQVGDMVRIDIADNGPGVSPDMQEQLFDRFSRGQDGAGFGVGLALARWVVEASGGTLDMLPVESGLHLRIALPLWKEG